MVTSDLRDNFFVEENSKSIFVFSFRNTELQIGLAQNYGVRSMFDAAALHALRNHSGISGDELF